MSDQPDHLVSPLYAMGQLQRAVTRAMSSDDAADRERALEIINALLGLTGLNLSGSHPGVHSPAGSQAQCGRGDQLSMFSETSQSRAALPGSVA